ncbi:hypothetical protein [Cysteiniphilum sp. 6C5]|uniref:hypothetical protein n=1 Tax=unclassified Cysteiniphilum TaxID=2610889 RepID=UPI003F829A33
MSLSKLFEKIKAPLKNNRWSWGGIRNDGIVCLRIWQDEKEKLDDKRLFFRLTNHQKYIDRQDDLGYKERLKHIELILSGAEVYLIMCKAKDGDAVPRSIESYNKKDLFVGGDIADFDGDKWIEMHRRIPISEISR